MSLGFIMRRVFPVLLRAAFGLLPISKLAAATAAGDPLSRTPVVNAAREQGLPFIELFDRRDYRGHAQIWTGVADARGLLYFGNHGQILVYDGVQWDRIAIPGATFVRSLAFDARGRLWVGASGALGYIDFAGNSPSPFVSLADRLPAAAEGPGDIVRVLVLGDSVYFQSPLWLFRWQDGNVEGWPLPPGPPTQSLIIDGEFLLQNPLRGWRRVGPEGLEPATAKLPRLPPTRFVFPLADNRRLFGTIFNGLFVSHGSVAVRHDTVADDLFASKLLFNGLQLRDGRFALSMLAGGTVILGADLSFQTLLDETTGLPSSAVNYAFSDAHGGLWLCLGDGIARVADTLAATWFRPPSPFGRIDADAFTRFGGQLYLGVTPELRRLTPASGVETARWELQEVIGSRHGGRIGALLNAGDTLLIAADDGCYAWREDKPSQRLAALRQASALLASAAQPGRYFVAHAGGIEALRRTAERWTAEGPLLHLEQDVRSLHEEPDGTLWAGFATGGVARIGFPGPDQLPVAELFTATQGLPVAPREVRIVRANDRPLFITARGLYRFEAAEKRFAPEPGYGTSFADGSTGVRALAENSAGDLWVAPQPAGEAQPWAQATLGRATPSGEWIPLPVSDLGRIGDILGLHLERAGEHEVLWAVGVSGILRVELDALLELPSAGPTLIRAVDSLADNLSLLPANAPAVLPYAKNSLHFRVAAPGLAAMSGVQFETEVVGFQRGARQFGPSAERELTNLAEGRYTFRARARAGDGRWTTPVEFSFLVLPPWWRTPWAYASWVALFLGGIIGLVRVRTRALRRRTALLETTVADRTRELHARNQELARLHRLELDEKTSAKLAAEKNRLEMLRYQLNPHFLFNTLNSLYSLVEEHPTAGHMVLRLSEFCRLTLTRGTDRTQTLAEEMNMLTAYLDIEKVRWGDSLQVAIEVQDAARSKPIPPFLLLPLVENAIKHGSQTSSDILQLRLSARITVDGALEFEIANTGHWLAPGTSVAPSTHVGLENIRERLARSYPGTHTFHHESSDGWVKVKLKLADRPPPDTSAGGPGAI